LIFCETFAMSKKIASQIFNYIGADADGAVGTEPSGCEEVPPVDPTQWNLPTSFEPHDWAWLFSGIATIIACVMSFYLIEKHLVNYNRPKIQKHIIRILFIVPIYSIDSWISFRFYRYGTYIDIVRDTYEAFVIYEFVSLCQELLGGSEGAILCLQSKESLSLPLPLCKVPVGNPHEVGEKFYRRVKQGTLQYVVICPITSAIAVITQFIGVYCSGNINPTYAWLYLAVILFLSVTIAMYSLITFYENTKDFLKPHKPLTKFISIKFVIFFCFWQGIAVSGLVKLQVIHATTYWTADNVASGVQNVLVCCEMVLASFLHLYAFAYKDYVIEGQRTPVFKSFLRVIYLKDVVLESKKHIVPSKIKNILTKEEIEMIPIEIVNEKGEIIETTAVAAKSDPASQNQGQVTELTDLELAKRKSAKQQQETEKIQNPDSNAKSSPSKDSEDEEAQE